MEARQLLAIDFLADDVLLDFGDLPEGDGFNYRTSLAENEQDSGPIHRLVPDVYLGGNVDAEQDGRPSLDALGDDQHFGENIFGNVLATSDEDGVNLNFYRDEQGKIQPNMFFPGGVARVEVHANVEGYLSAWIDYNGDGDFHDVNEQIADAESLSAGPNLLTLTVPLNAVVGDTYARFRFTSYSGDLGPDGVLDNWVVPDGEVEDYRLQIKTPYDFGDNPDSYQTLLASDGPSHRIVTGLHDHPGVHLGRYVDPDMDGQPEPWALGDDYDDEYDVLGIDDEDGVLNFDFDPYHGHDGENGGSSSKPKGIKVLVAGTEDVAEVVASTEGFLHAWIDFNGDGDFADPTEQIASSLPLDAGLNHVHFYVPWQAAKGETHARFRFTTIEGDLPWYGRTIVGGPNDGVEVDGEVEDYEVLLEPGIDYGDAPESYGDASHDIVSHFYLGHGVDVDPFSQIFDGNALGDDTYDGSDDEDGVVMRRTLMPGSIHHVTVTASAVGYLNAWVDFDADGSFDPSDQIFDDKLLNPGENHLTFTVPAGIDPAKTFARFRFSAETGVGPTGHYRYMDGQRMGNGEVEDYELAIGKQDFGDAPESYKTLEADLGAAHVQVRHSAPFMGTPADMEHDGQPSSDALGDDQTVLAGGLYGGVVDGSASFPGAVLSIDQADGGGTVLSDPVTPGGLSGLAFTSDDRLYGSIVGGASSGSELIALDPDTGLPLYMHEHRDNAVEIVDEEGEPVRIGDLAVQPLTDILYGLGSGDNAGELYTIDPESGVATYVGDTGVSGAGAIAFDWYGTLFMVADDDDADPEAFLHEVDPTNANILSTVQVVDESNVPVDVRIFGLGLRPADGLLFAAYGTSYPETIATIDPATGELVELGDTGVGTAGDLAFRPPKPGQDDEDGVFFDPSATLELGPDIPLVWGKNTLWIDTTNAPEFSSIDLPVPGMGGGSTYAYVSGYLNAWIDFDQSGMFDPDEQIAFDLPMLSGEINPVPFTIPEGFSEGQTYARFRISTERGLSPIGLAADGEVEDYQVSLVHEAKDYGDAPDANYATLLASDGARHVLPRTDVSITHNGVSNLGFEQGLLGWETGGTAKSVEVLSADNLSPGIDPTEGEHYALLSTGPGLVTPTDLPSLDEPNYDDDHDSSLLWTSFNLMPSHVPATISFDWNMLTSELSAEHHYHGGRPSLDDFFDVSLNGVSIANGSVYRVSGSGFPDTGPYDGVPYVVESDGPTDGSEFYDGQTGWQKFQFVITEPGNYTLKFAVADQGTWDQDPISPPYNGHDPYVPDDFDTGLLIDNVEICVQPEVGDLLRLGDEIDPETDGQPTISALGDDLDRQGDDEDGVTWTGDILPGLGVPIRVEVAGVEVGEVAFLDGWIDYNQDGDFDDQGEQFLFSTAVTNGTKMPQTVPVPTQVQIDGATAPTPVGLTYARIRISSEGQLTPRGEAADGEVEDYLVFIGNTMEWLDFGDAPDDAWIPPLEPGEGDPPDYVTLLGDADIMDDVEGGPRHAFDPNAVIYLGETIDMERDGQPTPMADGDDGARPDLTTPGGDPYDSHDDEDGVVFPDYALVPGQEATIQITAASHGYLDAWIDFDLDGVFEESERIADADHLEPGVTEWTFDVPMLGASDEPIHVMSYARFRFSSFDEGLPPTGWYGDGEVEDYKVNISNLDFGDAFNDPEDLFDYPTLLSHDGARHIIHPEGPVLGWDIDAELDGQPTVIHEAIGDDLAGIDDEDGVWLLDPLVADNEVRLVVNVVNAGGYFHGWMDFNGDLEWDDDGEKIVFDDDPSPLFLPVGTHTLTFEVPDGTPAGPTSLRFRITSDPGQLTTRGLAIDGEVEDYVYEVHEADYGDAPESYGTSLDANGPRHVISDVILGPRIDAERDGLPDDDARSDDRLNLDDEDGVTFAGFSQSDLPQLATGTFVDVDVVSSVDGAYLNAWIDFDGSGVFGDSPAEHVFADVELAAGTNTLTFFVEPSAVADLTYARFRLSTEAGLWPTGPAPDGEVEDYKLDIVRGLDFGDTPEPDYSTLLQNPADPPSDDPGPHHEITGLFLGQKIDAEPDGQPHVNALGDDLLDGNDDEDGVWFLTPLVPGETAEVKVVSSEPGYLNAWIDFRRDGDWDDNGEHIIVDYFTTGGGAADTISFTVPQYAQPGQLTYARFRLSSYDYANDNLGPDGIVPATNSREALIPDGEVEDYQVVLGEVKDWGDAPDGIHDAPAPCYPTLDVNDGARHLIVSGAFLGLSVDPEADGQPEPMALGDDNAQLDDEDGVTWLEPLVPGRGATVEVTASVPGFLNAWIDFNADGDWNDPNEWIAAREIDGGPMLLGGGGPTVIEFWVPEDAVVGKTFSRFRFQPAPEEGVLVPEEFVLTPYHGEEECELGCVPGEVEDHAVMIAPPLDFGDAETSYATLLADDGPRHVIIPHFQLGHAIDVDADGQPDMFALGDDLDADGDDEDGVSLPATPLVPGQEATIEVFASAAGRLDAWIDADGDGVFEHPGEQVLTSQAVNPGSNTLTFTVPLAEGDIVSMARFRFSLNGGLTPTGMAADGEVEDYQVRLDIGPSVLLDYGDAPQPYPTTLADDGPRHVVVEGFHLGADVDIDPDGQPAPDADGDDGQRTDLGYDANDDEDGVTFTSILLLNDSATLDVEASADGLLDAWIDFNRDGDFLDAGEQIFNSTSLAAGVNSLVYDVPGDAVTGPTVGRFRFSSTGGLSPSGPAGDGEVEDHLLSIPTAVLRVDLVEADGVTPIADGTVEVGEQFFVKIDGLDNRSTPSGIIGLDVSLDWDADVLDYVGGGFGTGDPNDLPITASFPSARIGSVDHGGGLITLSAFSTPAAGAPNAAIGASGFENFSMLLFRADMETTVDTLLDLVLNSSVIMADNVEAPGAAQDAELAVVAMTDRPQIDVLSDGVRFSTVFEENLDIRLDSESPLVRPNYPDTTKFFEVENTGTGTLRIDEILLNASLGGDVTVSPLPTMLSPIMVPAGGTQRFDLVYAPTNPQTPIGGNPGTPPDQFDLSDGLTIISNAVNGPADLRLMGASTFNCDISYDGACGVVDRNLLESPRFFNNPANYDPTFDMDGDGSIDLPDAGVINVEFGDTRALAADDEATTAEDVAVNVSVGGNDMNVTSSLALQVVPQTGGDSAIGGTAVVNDGGTPLDPLDDTIDFTPDSGFTGTAQFWYAYFDGANLASNVALVEVEVLAGSPLRAADAAAVTDVVPPELTTGDLAPIVEQALLLWEQAAPEANVADALAGVEIRVADLSGDLLGLATEREILIDTDAAGHGWFVDPTPGDSLEFVCEPLLVSTLPSGDGLLDPALDQLAGNRIDLLTVVAHELGHLLGLEDQEESGHDGVMAARLAAGTRRLPTAGDLASDEAPAGGESSLIEVTAGEAEAFEQTADALFGEDDNWLTDPSFEL